MSAKATYFVWKLSLSASEKLVALCLADCHNADTNQCNPSIKYIAKRTGLNPKTISKCKNELVKKGCISVRSKRGQSDIFIFNFSSDPYQNWDTPKTDPLQNRVTPKTDPLQNRVTPKTDHSDTNFTDLPPPKLGHKSTKESTKNLLNLKPGFLSAQIWNDWIEFRKEIRKPLKPTTVKQQVKFLSEQPNPELVIEQSIRNGWTGLFELKGGQAHATSSRNPTFDDISEGLRQYEIGGRSEGAIIDGEVLATHD